MISKKWDKIFDLRELLGDENRMFDTSDKSLRRLTYAPNMGYFTWIFSYKGLLVALFDAGNGHWEFFSLVSVWDLITAKIADLIERR